MATPRVGGREGAGGGGGSGYARHRYARQRHRYVRHRFVRHRYARQASGKSWARSVKTPVTPHSASFRAFFTEFTVHTFTP